MAAEAESLDRDVGPASAYSVEVAPASRPATWTASCLVDAGTGLESLLWLAED